MNQSKIDRARAWLRNTPGAVAGQGGHNATFAVATALIHGFELNAGDAESLLHEYNAKCLPPWKPNELAHKLDQASKVPHDKPRGWLLESNSGMGQGGTPVSPTGKFVVRKIQAIPQSDFRFSTIDFLKACFEPDEVVCICNDIVSDDEGRTRPNSKGTFLKRDEWIKNHFTPPISAMWNGPDSRGAYVRVNPCFDESGSDSGVAAFRHVLVEMDEKTKDEQWTILKESKLPMSVVIDSGGKSLHGWVRVDAANKEEWSERRDVVYRQLEALGIDPKNKNASRFSRLAGVMRDGNEQKLLAINVGVVNWDAFTDYLESQDMPQEFSLDSIIEYDPKNDPDNLIGDRWLRRGSSLLFVGQSGCGKSSMAAYQGMKWASGEAWFGVKPVRALKVAYIQAENDIADQHDALKGAAQMTFGKENWERGLRSVDMLFFRETVRTGTDFATMLRRLVRKTKADVVYIDPLLSYMGGNPADIEVCANFTRHLLQPIMMETGVVLVLVHHFPKPKGKDDKPESVADLAYSGFGSSDLTNWAREVIVMKEVGFNNPRKFMLGMAKRADRSGMTDKDGKVTGSIMIQRGSNGDISWNYAEPEKFVVDKESAKKPYSKGRYPKR
jgi:RecA-family ATPase